MKALCRILLAASAMFVGTATAQAHELRLTLKQVHSSAGNVMVALCGERNGQFPGGCGTYRAMQKAQEGDLLVIFDDVAPGTYAIQAFHDENGNGQPDMPPEGYAFSNNPRWPVSFEAASIAVSAGVTEVSATMTYDFGTR